MQMAPTNIYLFTAYIATKTKKRKKVAVAIVVDTTTAVGGIVARAGVVLMAVEPPDVVGVGVAVVEMVVDPIRFLRHRATKENTWMSRRVISFSLH